MQGTIFEERLAGAFKKALQSGTVAISTLATGSQTKDRYGREPVLILTRNEVVQLYLLRAGLTRFVGFPGMAGEAVRASFLEAEEEARSTEAGLWKDPRYSVFSAETAPERDGFAIVEGKPIGTAHTRSMVYLNFGEDWRTDFTAAIEPGLLKTDAWAGWDIDALVGRKLRLRGWMRPYNGAFMTLTGPDQIEILTSGPAD